MISNGFWMYKSSVIKQSSASSKHTEQNGVLCNSKQTVLTGFSENYYTLLCVHSISGSCSYCSVLWRDKSEYKIIKLDKYRAFPVFLYSVHTKSQGFCVGFPFDISKDIEQAVMEAHQLLKSQQTNPVGHKNLICRFEWAYRSFRLPRKRAPCSLSPQAVRRQQIFISRSYLFSQTEIITIRNVCICTGKHVSLHDDELVERATGYR